ncbi:MAG: GMC family oxidoreductase [Deltaproteobacteria bacterium]|nr:GMC family oxidoreductase [Deltaproteobacteria bacterium]
MSTLFDAVVVGSGAGGAPLACRLCQAGWKVLLVERGVAYQKGDFDRDEIEWCRRDRFVPSPKTDPHTRRSDEGQRATPSADGWISTVLGGGTVHMGAYLMRAGVDDTRQATRLQGSTDRGHTALDWVVPHKEFERYYDVAEDDLGVSGGKGSGLPFLSHHALASKLDDAAKKVGLSSTPTPRGILTAGRPDDDRLPCAYRQLCASYGCPNDAKSSMPATYLRRAQKTGNLTVRTETLATKIVLDPVTKKASGVVVRDLKAGREETITAKVVVVAAGAVESARLLLLSGEGFNPQGQVGRNLWFSLFVEVAGFFSKEKHADVVDLMSGSPFLNRSVAVDRTLDPGAQKAALVDRTGMFQMSFVHDNPIHRAERVATETLDAGKVLWGRDLKLALQKEFRGGRRVILEGFGEQLPHLGMYVDLDPDVKDRHGLAAARMTIWHHGRDKRVATWMQKDGSALLTAAGADDVKVVRSMSETTVLQGGTCRFGDDEKTSVIDRDGALHAVKNVYVADGGALPSSMTVPATLTIVANSLRTAERLLAREK